MSAIMAETTKEAFLLLVTFWHGTTTFRCAMNTEDVVSRGHTFTATYFDFKMPEVSDKAPEGCQIVVDNVDTRMIDMLRRIVTPMDVKIELVLASQPNVVELELNDLKLREVTWDVSQISGTLRIEDMLNAGFPGNIYEPRTFQGIF